MIRVATLLALSAVASGAAGQWPEFRGPTGQGQSAERGLPVEWSESSNIIWKVPVAGSGWSSPVIADGRVWLTTAVEAPPGSRSVRGVSLRTVAFDERTGREIVNVEVFHVDHPGALNPKNSRASPTPIVDGDRVYVHFGADGTAALSAAGDIVWRARLLYESQHGSGGSPALYHDLLIVNCDGGSEAFVAALDTHTGKVRWKAPRRQPFDQAYSTPLVIRVDDRDEVISVGAFRATAYEPATGKEIWRVEYADGFSNVPRPVYAHGLVYIATGFNQPSLLAVRAKGTGDITKTEVAWTMRRAAPLTPSPLVVGDDLYLVNDGGIISCLDARTGEVRWQQRLGGSYSASPVYADGRIYFLSEDGVTTVVEPGATLRVVARNQLDGATLASIGIADRSIFIRTIDRLYRIGIVQ
ncbi:MAG: pyrrolo-quinoline quinone [Acidobacteria bacterium]|nr:MAG: pyrrolo-quinoline quinone [Acidobacteriota bacterium]